MLFHCIRRLILLAAFLILMASTGSHASTNHHVVLITMDGLAAYMLTDPQASIPNIRRLAAEGAAAEALKVSSPAVTWPNHTTLVTGVHPSKHSVLFNGFLARAEPGWPVKLESKRDKHDLVAVPTLFDRLHQAGYRTAGVNWPCTSNSGTLDDDFPDAPEQITHSTPRLRNELLALGVLKDATDKSFGALSAAARDQIWTAAAVHLIKSRKPNLLLVHMLVTDSIQHKYGPQSPAAYTAIALADAQLGQILQALDAAGIRERTSVFVTADHGFAKALKLLNPNVMLRKAGLLELGATNQLLKARAQVVSEAGLAMLYLTNPGFAEADRAKVKSLMQTQEGIAEIIEPTRFASLGLPDPATNRQMADLILVAKDGYAFTNVAVGDDYVTAVTLASGNQGHHGYLASNPKMDAVFIAWGRGIKRGAKLGVIENTAVAPTIAKLLNQNLPGADAQPLQEILMDSEK
ncbi:MAG: ectonucleotide pyrophosphatase/phosphodiesterase [Verrucomicrobiales bacterium]|nr:ectonucleotide pyrophosphatase/phosphodiesterase [Verrucomicrobiales bacterium]